MDFGHIDTDDTTQSFNKNLEMMLLSQNSRVVSPMNTILEYDNLLSFMIHIWHNINKLNYKKYGTNTFPQEQLQQLG